jgi:hypothetical protein
VLQAKSGDLPNAEKGGRQSENSRNLGRGLLPVPNGRYRGQTYVPSGHCRCQSYRSDSPVLHFVELRCEEICQLRAHGFENP